MTILFSPIGTADPFTMLGDGPMIHIVRIKKPEKVVLFFSPKMAACQHADQRYTKAIELVSEKLGMKMPQIETIESDFTEVHRFDHYIEEFEPALQKLASEGDLLVNVSSGTPGMAQALVAIGSFGRIDLKLLQVSTPKRSNNEGQDRENPDKYDLEALWEWDKIIENGTSRIDNVQTPNFSERLLRENIADLVEAYEYEAAYELACKSRLMNDRTKQLIKAAAERLNLDGELPAQIFKGSELHYRPNDLLAEYLSVMEVRLAQGHWAEFLRSLTPALTATMKRTLAPYIRESSYMRYKNGKPTGKYNLTAIGRDPRLSKTLRADRLHESDYIENGGYIKLIDEYCNDEVAKKKLDRLRHVESDCRNGLAHSIKKSSKVSLERECGMPLEQVMDFLFDLNGNETRGLYRRINEKIMQELNS